MGPIGINISTSSYSEGKPPAMPMPDPENFRFLKAEQVGRHLVLSVYYPDCTNYEGKKVLLYLFASLKKIISQKSIDPHFCDNPARYSPFARFEPTERGWQAALKLAKLLEDL